MTLAFKSPMYATGLLSNKHINIDRSVRKYAKVHAPRINMYTSETKIYTCSEKTKCSIVCVFGGGGNPLIVKTGIYPPPRIYTVTNQMYAYV